MRFYEIIAEQLDLAAELLQEQHAMQSRLALILVDNAVEFALHRHAVDHFLLNPVPNYLPVPERRRQHKKRAKICGQRLKRKVAFARCKDAITEDQATFVRNAHEFRNQAYHAGRGHDPIITELATAYYALFCEMIPNLAPRMITARIGASYSQRVARHIRNDAQPFLPGRESAELVAGSLLHVLPEPNRSLSEAFQEALAAVLVEIRCCIDYLVRYEPNVNNAERLILDTQFWHAFWGAAPVEGLTVRVDEAGMAEVDPDQKDEWEEALRQMRASWSPRVSLNTLDKWDRRITELTRESNPGTLLQKYCKLHAEMEPFRKMLLER